MFELMLREYFEPHRQETLGKHKIQLWVFFFSCISLLFLSVLLFFFFLLIIKTHKQTELVAYPCLSVSQPQGQFIHSSSVKGSPKVVLHTLGSRST